MSAEIEQARHEIAATRAQIEATANELKETISRRVDRAREVVNPAYYAREFPWAALGLAIGAGIAIGLTRAEARAASAAVDGAKAAGSKIGDGAVAAKDAVVDKLSGEKTPEPTLAESAQTDDVRTAFHGPMSAVHGLLDDGLQELLGALGVSREEVQQRLSS